MKSVEGHQWELILDDGVASLACLDPCEQGPDDEPCACSFPERVLEGMEGAVELRLIGRKGADGALRAEVAEATVASPLL